MNRIGGAMIVRKSLVIAFGAAAAICALAVAGCGTGGGEDAKFERLGERYFRENFRINPVFTT